MKNIFKNKKLLLIFLTVILLLILLSTYIKTREIELNTIFDSNDKVVDKELLFKADKNIKNHKTEQKKALAETKNNQRTKLEEERKIENIVLISEIKDPFQEEVEQKKKAEAAEEKPSEVEELKTNFNQDLIFLEKNIIADNLINQTQNREKMIQSKTEVNQKSSLSKTNQNREENKSSIKPKNLKNIRLPFKLIGIIKNKNKSSALFLHQGQTLLKTEKEKIDIFKIEKINNNNLIISYQKEERRLYLWKEKNYGN